jgi:hypothetical protein
VALRGKVIDPLLLNLLNNANDVRRVGKITVVKNQIAMLGVRILGQVVDAIRVEERCTALHTVHHVTALQQKVGEIGAVLTGNARDEGDSLHESFTSTLLEKGYVVTDAPRCMII